MESNWRMNVFLTGIDNVLVRKFAYLVGLPTLGVVQFSNMWAGLLSADPSLPPEARWVFGTFFSGGPTPLSFPYGFNVLPD